MTPLPPVLELSEIVSAKSGWNAKVVPRTITALAVFITLSKYLRKNDWVQYFEKAVYKILARNNYVATGDNLVEKENLVNEENLAKREENPVEREKSRAEREENDLYLENF